MSWTEAQREGWTDSLEEEDQEFALGCVDLETPTKYQYRDVQGIAANQPGAQRRVPRQTHSKFK